MRAGRLLSYGAVVFGLVDLAIFLYPLGYVAVWPAVAGMIVVGLPGALTLAGLMTLFQRSSEDSYRGRVFGAVSALEGVTVLAGTLGAGYLSRFAGIVPVLAIQGGGVRGGRAGHAHLAQGRAGRIRKRPRCRRSYRCRRGHQRRRTGAGRGGRGPQSRIGRCGVPVRARARWPGGSR